MAMAYETAAVAASLAEAKEPKLGHSWPRKPASSRTTGSGAPPRTGSKTIASGLRSSVAARASRKQSVTMEVRERRPTSERKQPLLCALID